MMHQLQLLARPLNSGVTAAAFHKAGQPTTSTTTSMWFLLYRHYSSSTSGMRRGSSNNAVAEQTERIERNELLRAIQENDDLRNTMAYSLAMASLEGNRFPPLIRPLNERERRQVRISKEQGLYMMSSSST